MSFNWSKFGLSIILVLLLFSCNSLKDEHLEVNITCDAETTIDFLGKTFIEGSDGLLLTGGAYRTDEEAHSGNYSIKLGGEDKYAFQVKFKDIEKDMFIRATIWKKGEGGNLAFTSDKNLGFKHYSKLVNTSDSSGWKQLILESFVPANYKGEEIKLFAMNNSEERVYFDDLEVKVFREKPYPEYNDIANIELLIDEDILEEIDQNREKSFWKGVITKKTKKKFPAVFSYDGKRMEAELRIKGDWLDHIQGNKLSYRIKLLEGNFMGMREFSIQQPGARGFMHEYVIHKLFLEEDILTTQYGFVPVKINGKNRGIYAYEEHFAKHLVESRDRREGPIVKFDESALWKINRENLYRKDSLVSGPVVESAVITPFKDGKTTRNPVLKGNFIIAQNLLNQYRLDSAPISALFKVDELAKFYALINLGRTWHSTRWHNERYYYDPLSSKMEIIAYDCYTASELDELEVILTPQTIELTPNFDYDRYLSYSPFNDAHFADEYSKVMNYYLTENRIQEILEKYKVEIEENTELIKREYSYYSYDPGFFQDGIDQVKPIWNDLEAKIKSQTLKSHLEIPEYNYKHVAPIEGMNLEAFARTPYALDVKNYHSEKLYLIAYSSKDLPEQGIVELEEPVEFPAYVDLNKLSSRTIKTAFTPTKIYFKTTLEDSITYDVDAYNWPMPGVDSPRQELLRLAIQKSTPFCTVTDSTVIFKKGNFTFASPIIIPEGKKVIFKEGVNLDFIDGAFFMSFSPIYIKGKEASPIRILSSDGSARGFTIIDAHERSSLENVQFIGFNTLSYKGWNLTGAVSFYQSDVDINNAQFLENHCEDALNIVRSNFLMQNSKIEDAYADGFDADFVSGRVENCSFSRIGNDGLDFSGSRIKISNVTIDGVGDKGVSGGESSTLSLSDLVVVNANIGVASKDRSNVKVNTISISDTYCAFAVYQKKSEYEPAKMEVENVKLENIGRENLLGLESILIIDKDKIIGIEKINIDSLYGL
jgi:hypothetical protein